jgi:hypothetical protein
MMSSPLEGVASARLVFPAGPVQLLIRTSVSMAALYQARFEGVAPTANVRDGTVTFRYPKRLSLFGERPQAAEITLNSAIPWRLVIQGGASDITAELRDLDLTGMEITAGKCTIHVELPAPSGVVPIRISGGVDDVTIRRPAGVAARVRLLGPVSALTFDDQLVNNLAAAFRLQSPGYETATQRYDIQLASPASTYTVGIE